MLLRGGRPTTVVIVESLRCGRAFARSQSRGRMRPRIARSKQKAVGHTSYCAQRVRCPRGGLQLHTARTGGTAQTTRAANRGFASTTRKPIGSVVPGRAVVAPVALKSNAVHRGLSERAQGSPCAGLSAQ